MRINRSSEIARAKRELDAKYGETPPQPFRGWHSRGYLPHCDKPGLVQMVTFRLDDAMPAERRREWQVLDAIEDERVRRTKLEAYLDRGYGACYLKRPEVAKLVQDSLLFHDGERYRLCGWVIMPNHVHALFEVWMVPMEELICSWKRFTATRINRLLGHAGRLWEPEYWDRYMRDEEHFGRALRYIERNPVKAGLCACARDWAWSSARSEWRWDIGEGHTRFFGGHLVSEAWTRAGARDSDPAI